MQQNKETEEEEEEEGVENEKEEEEERKENNISLCFISFVAHSNIILRKHLSIFFIAMIHCTGDFSFNYK